MSSDVAARIREAITDHGPITFAEFMEHALYGPGGFYEDPAVGREGHFLTSPHVHPVFAELLLRALGGLWEGLGRPDPFAVVEVGAGDGTLARDLLRLAAESGGPRLAYATVERSLGARERLADLHARTVTDRFDRLGELPRAVVFANELLDNLPFHRVRATRSGLVEVRIGIDGPGFTEVETPADARLAELAPDLRRGEEATVPLAALALTDEVAAALRSGYVLMIDYGSAGRGPAGQVHGYRHHRVVADVLSDPGEADITAGVDFGLLAGRAAERGLTPLGVPTQRDALLALGLGDWDEHQRDRQSRMMADGAGGRAVQVWEGRSRASLLADRTGLGRLRWLLLATPSLPVPRWLPRDP